ncbi:SEC-C metal-binding domain-containing protein [Sporosarcina aquimarina]|uniref:SEC-C metal-binding domain-containing protein n=1 Tax=Sporosarcina aquimarina TaxID=114975 RepID=UPI001C8ED351|nr:SEC-C metal-binding domain-containing protein [Sporosarcina aquimarina]MBY0223961.1 SEC-C domain-containing protein [Sporosarcina aquimarina]
MVGRNEPCPCGSGKKYKKCCESKQAVSVEEVQTEEMERLLQTFYDTYPERKDVSEFIDFADSWKSSLREYLTEDMIEAIALDEFFFHQRSDIWESYIEKQKKKQVRPSILGLLDQWAHPRVFIGKVTAVDETYMTAASIIGDETIQLWKESEKPVPAGVHFYCFLLPDGTEEGNYLAVSSLIFFPTDHSEAIKQFANSIDQVKEHTMSFWVKLGENGYAGDEFTEFESGVLQAAAEFLEMSERQSDALLELIEDFLVEQQPNARKEVAIAAGAIRYGQENELFEPLTMTWKDIAEHFDVSPSSMNKYAKEITEYVLQQN